eukprot:4528344-Karenia_brevis.AAC.1
MMKVPAVPLHEFLTTGSCGEPLPPVEDKSQEKQIREKRTKKQRAEDPGAGDPKVFEYQADHLECFMVAGLTYPPVFSDDFFQEKRQ